MSNNPLEEALGGIVKTAVDESLKKLDFEQVIKDEIKKVTENIPSRKLQIIDVEGMTTDMKLVHKQFELLLKCVMTTRPILLKGEAGTAKSHNAMEVAKALGLDFYSLSVGEQTTKSDLLGFKDAMGKYSSTAFRKAFEHGGIFLLDEIDAGNPNVLLQINSGVSNGFLEFPDGEVTRHKDFRLIATANTFGNGADGNYVGRNKLDKATVNRFIPIVWTLDEYIEEMLVDNPAWLKVIRKARKLAYDNLDEVLLGMRNATYGADLLAVGVSFEETFDMVVLNGLSEDDQQLLSQAKELWREPTSSSSVEEAPVEAEVYESDYVEIQLGADVTADNDEFNF